MQRKTCYLMIFVFVFLSIACSFTTTIGAATATPEMAASSGDNGIITGVTLAKSVKGSDPNNVTPVNPTKIFSPTDKIYIVVAIKNAPDGTKVTAKWYVVDAGSAAKANSLIASTDLTRSGTLNLPFSITPANAAHAWPAGSYRVEVYIDDSRVKTLDYSVK